jgi:glycosyltransferase involved in cell wall biosynthesis
VAGTAGRAALPAAWLGARRARVPFVLWSARWAELTTPAHVLARPLMAAIYRDAAAVVAYGPHVAAFARAHGARRVEIAPQAVDNAFRSAPAAAPERPAPFTVLFVGRPAREKGVPELVAAWRAAALDPAEAALVLAGDGHEARPGVPGLQVAGALRPANLRNFYAGASVLAIPSIPSRRFVEPWGLVANEAMNQHCAVIATDAVGAAAGGLVRQEATGLVVPAADSAALGAAIRRLHDDPALRARLAEEGARAVTAYTYEAWASGFAAALAGTTTAGEGC